MQADPCHRYVHMSFCWFCRAVAQLYYYYLSGAATYKLRIEEFIRRKRIQISITL